MEQAIELAVEATRLTLADNHHVWVVDDDLSHEEIQDRFRHDSLKSEILQRMSELLERQK